MAIQLITSRFTMSSLYSTRLKWQQPRYQSATIFFEFSLREHFQIHRLRDCVQRRFGSCIFLGWRFYMHANSCSLDWMVEGRAYEMHQISCWSLCERSCKYHFGCDNDWPANLWSYKIAALAFKEAFCLRNVFSRLSVMSHQVKILSNCW